MDAIMFQSGMMVICGLHYTDGKSVCRCRTSGNPLAFGDSPYFDEKRTKNFTVLESN